MDLRPRSLNGRAFMLEFALLARAAARILCDKVRKATSLVAISAS